MVISSRKPCRLSIEEMFPFMLTWPNGVEPKGHRRITTLEFCYCSACLVFSSEFWRAYVQPDKNKRMLALQDLFMDIRDMLLCFLYRTAVLEVLHGQGKDLPPWDDLLRWGLVQGYENFEKILAEFFSAFDFHRKDGPRRRKQMPHENAHAIRRRFLQQAIPNDHKRNKEYPRDQCILCQYRHDVDKCIACIRSEQKCGCFPGDFSLERVLELFNNESASQEDFRRMLTSPSANGGLGACVSHPMSDVSDRPGRGRPGMDGLVEHPLQTTCDIGQLACCIQEHRRACLVASRPCILTLIFVRMAGRRRARGSGCRKGRDKRESNEGND